MENIALIGQYCGRQALLTKYIFDFPIEVIRKDVIRLTNQIWKLIPMREHEEDWQKQLDTVIIEIAGLYEIFYTNPKFITLLAKLEGLNYEGITFELHRKTVFESISLLREVLQ